ncbi:helix-turn-helix domain-containing protein [Microbacterium invictum]|uniref:Helix-turn-helix domain-containing protein n=1 Tax=Microbacterium invictum TaxID=515415 RepID=A0ABZ0VIC0_9MICO|nr:helix-turn-helix domain-containing protein [Microbacterium invictum]WQB71542.1 helix-turn-helix domain-containing protein [Microbacterium invictum]
MADTLGARIRAARVSRGLSLRSVAQSLGVSASLVSQVEIGKTQPSVSTLYAIANHLGVSLDELVGGAAASAPAGAIADAAASAIQRAAENPAIEMENGVRWERLAGQPGGPADALLVTYQPGASSSIEGKLMRHAGTEYAYLLEGELTLQLEFDTHVLRAGDSLHFDSTRPHLFSNRAEAPARGVWFVVGRRQHHQEMPVAPGYDDAEAGGQPAAAPSSAVDVLRAMEGMADPATR